MTSSTSSRTSTTSSRTSTTSSRTPSTSSITSSTSSRTLYNLLEDPFNLLNNLYNLLNNLYNLLEGPFNLLNNLYNLLNNLYNLLEDPFNLLNDLYNLLEDLYNLANLLINQKTTLSHQCFWPAGIIPMRSEQGSKASSGQFGSTPPSICVLQISPWMTSLNMPSPPTHTTLSRVVKVRCYKVQWLFISQFLCLKQCVHFHWKCKKVCSKT